MGGPAREREADAFERAREKDRALSERELSLLVRERESPPCLRAVSFSERGRERGGGFSVTE